jgi:hypothetical protein
MARIPLGLAAWAAACLVAAPAANAAPRIFILSGQSNMAGLGKIPAIPAGYLNGVNNVAYYVAAQHPALAGWNYRYAPDIGTAGGLGNPCDDTQCSCYQTGTFGPEAGMAKVLSAAYPAEQIILVKAAWGGTGLAANWLNPNDPLYAWFIGITRQMIDAAKARYAGATLAGFVWLQGESDGLDLGYARAYGANLSRFIDKVRADLSVPQLPFLYGSIRNAVGKDGKRRWPFGNIVIHTQKTFRDRAFVGCTGKSSSARASVYPAEIAADCNAFPCDDACRGFNSYHYDAAGQIFAGEALGRAVVDFFAGGAGTLKCRDYAVSPES